MLFSTTTSNRIHVRVSCFLSRCFSNIFTYYEFSSRYDILRVI